MQKIKLKVSPKQSQTVRKKRPPSLRAGPAKTIGQHLIARLQEVLRLAEQYHIPIATTLMGKSTVRETHPLHMGIYAAAIGRPEVGKIVEDSDCLILLGAFLTDIDTGVATPRLDPEKCISATSERLQIRHHHFHDVLLQDFISGLVQAAKGLPESKARRNYVRTVLKRSEKLARPKEKSGDTAGRAHDPITVPRIFEQLDDFLTDDMMVIADVGDALFGAIDLVTYHSTEFLGMAYYTSMGFAVPAAVGAGLANRQRRPLVIVGDGAFQMTGMELSTIVRLGLNPIVLVFNNGGYGTERLLHPGCWEFNKIPNWQYHRLPEILGGGRGFDIRTEADFAMALQQAKSNHDSFSLLNVHLASDDHSAALGRLAKRLSQHV